MKEHNSNYNNQVSIRSVENGYIVTHMRGVLTDEYVYKTMTEVVNDLADCFGLTAIGEEITITTKQDEE